MVDIKTPTDRMMARTALIILALGALYGVYSFGQPVYWRFYATVLRPFEDAGAIEPLDEDPFAAAVMDKKHAQSTTNAAASGGGKTDAAAGGVTAPKTEAAKVEVKAPAKVEVKAPVISSAAQKPFDPAKYNPDDYPLTKERVHALAQDGYIMVTWANHHYLDFAKSWVHHVKKCGLTAYMVGAMDDEMLRQLAERNVVTWRMNTGIHKGDLGWGSQNFHKMGRFKIALIKLFLDLDVTMVISDIDTAWLRNPIPYFQRYPEADVLTSSDELHETVPDESLEQYPQASSSFNIGIMMFRVSSKALVDEWIKSLEDPQMWDQTAFNQISRKGASFSKKENKNLWRGYGGTLNIGILPTSIFSSGHMFFVQTKYKELGLQPYVAHATFQYSGTPGKRNRFREFLLWDDPPEYFDSPKGYLTMTIDIPKELWERAKQPVQGMMTPDKLEDHFKLVHFQLAHLRTALTLATLTGRIVVMPPIWCQLDKYWAPLDNGNIPGSKFIKPFICPMDHVLDIEGGWHPVRQEEQWGPQIEWREYSFLQNPRLTPAVNNSRVELEVCQGCDNKVKDGKLRVPTGVDTTALKATLAAAAAPSAARILHVPQAALDALRPLWTTFPDKDKERFTFRLKHMTSVFCCLQTSPGWIWYSLFPDIEHKDRMNRPQGGATYTYYAGDSKTVLDPKKPARLSSSRKVLALPGHTQQEVELVSESTRLQEAGDAEAVLETMRMDAMFSIP